MSCEHVNIRKCSDVLCGSRCYVPGLAAQKMSLFFDFLLMACISERMVEMSRACEGDQ